MFRKHPLRDFMIFLLVGITFTFAFNVQAVEVAEQTINAQSFLAWQHYY
ncbi:MAG: hypothetical protein OEY52_06190 [Gammaproteobacteria bacterium]|nr:hypothetical protein [Gammaproteobacteria bacterium]